MMMMMMMMAIMMLTIKQVLLRAELNLSTVNKIKQHVLVCCVCEDCKSQTLNIDTLSLTAELSERQKAVDKLN